MIGPLFLAVEPDEETNSLLAQMLARAKDDEWPLPGRLSPSDNWHITVRFLGSVDDLTLDRLTAGLDGAASSEPGWTGDPIPVTLRGIDRFPRPDRASVLWVGVESDALIELAEAIEELVTSIGIPPDEPPYRPHLTLSRIRPPQDLLGPHRNIHEDGHMAGHVFVNLDQLLVYDFGPTAGSGHRTQSSTRMTPADHRTGFVSNPALGPAPGLRSVAPE